MADALHTATMELRTSVDPVLLGLAPPTWIVWSSKADGRLPTADESRVRNTIARKYWKVAAGFLAEMTAPEKAVVDAAEAAVVTEAASRVADLDRVRTRLAAMRTEIAAIKAATPTTVPQCNTLIDRICDINDDLVRAVYRLTEGSR